MPDVFNRIQAGTKTTTLGTILTLAGAACIHPDWGLKLLLIGLFLLFTNPLSSQVLSRASHRYLALGRDKYPDMCIDKLEEDMGVETTAEAISDTSSKVSKEIHTDQQVIATKLDKANQQGVNS
jgi:multicomponent Na+:H+ antiporter subunit G